jgi:hypothetical protein
MHSNACRYDRVSSKFSDPVLGEGPERLRAQRDLGGLQSNVSKLAMVFSVYFVS